MATSATSNDRSYPFLPIIGGFRIGETETHYIDVVRKLYSWRIVRSAKSSPATYDRGYCYFGSDGPTLIKAVIAALAWDGGDDTEPEGWNKNVFTQEWRESPT